MDLQFLESNKKTQSMNKIKSVLEFVHALPGIGEGSGGERDLWGGGGIVGTGMRAPWGPLYDMPLSWRRSLLNFCISKGVLREDSGSFYVTGKGIEVLEQLACKKCGQLKKAYLVKYHSTEAIGLYCECNKRGVLIEKDEKRS